MRTWWRFNCISICQSAAALSLMALLAGIVALSSGSAMIPGAAQAQYQQYQSNQGAIAAMELGDAFSDVAESSLPAVVMITSERVVSLRDQTPFDEFFNFFGNRGGIPQEFRQRGLGSGFIVDTNGTILTSSHVVYQTESIQVMLSDNRQFDAEIVGTDPETDVAVLRIKAQGLPVLPLGDSDAMRIGQWVLALGNPFGVALQGTVTAGIISAKGRSRIGIADYEDFIQTDAAINPGNSGGPLINLAGEVIGINTAIATRTGGYQGVGFAIPSNLVRHVMNSLLTEGHVTRGWLGVYIQDLTDELRAAMKTQIQGGVLVSEVMKDSPAEHAGLKAGDVLVEMDGVALHDVNDLRMRIADTRPGTTIRFTVVRDDQEQTFDVRVAEREETQASAGQQGQGPGAGTLDNLGFTGETLNDEYIAELNLERGTKGVVITEVEPDSPADRAGLQQGNVIVEANRRPVENVSQLRAAVSDLGPGDTLLLYIITDSARRFVAIPIPEQ